MASTKATIDYEWADSLVVLSMSVPDHWWKEYKSYSLNDGQIVSFNIPTQRWHLLLDTLEDGDDLYPMSYQAVCLYSNKRSSSFTDFILPHKPIQEGDGPWYRRVTQGMESSTRRRRKNNQSHSMEWGDKEFLLI
jgi:hypothetical protein